jgi:hypothetical protein
MDETELATLQRPLEALPYRPLFAPSAGHILGRAPQLWRRMAIMQVIAVDRPPNAYQVIRARTKG